MPNPLQEMRQLLKPLNWAVGTVSFFINLLILPMSIYSLQVMDRVMNTGSIHTLLWLTVIMLAMFAAAGLLQALRGIVLSRAADWLYDRIAETALPLVLAQAASGGKGTQHLRDAASLKQFISGQALITLMDAPWSVLYIAGLFIIHSLLGIMVTAGAALLVLLAWLNERAVRTPMKEAGARQLRNMQELEMATRNAEVTEAMGITGVLAERWKRMQSHASIAQACANDRSSVVMGGTKFVRLSLQILVTCAAAWLAVYGSVTMGAIIASSILASRALAPFEAAIGSWKSLIESRAAYGRLYAAFDIHADAKETMQLPAPTGAVSVEHLCYRVEGREEPLLDDIHFSLAAGESLGIIGPSGSGKSTLTRLLIGLRAPASGVARLDGADMYRWPREELGKYIGYLPQDVELFAGSVRDNIARFQPEATPESIVQAAKIASAHELILRLPQGYDTDIGAGGNLLSAGQRQRIGLARAFFGLPKLLVLDEPDANLDDAGLQSLMLALHLAKQQRITTVMVTHRKSLLTHTDKILLLTEGKMDAFGTFAEVMEHINQRQAPVRQVAGHA